jgi:hypothetical protein
MIIKFNGQDIKVSWGMLFVEHIWASAKPNNFTGSDLVATLVYNGNLTHCRLTDESPAFDAKSDVYKVIADKFLDPEFTKEYVAIIEAWKGTGEYEELFGSVAQEDSKKK